MVRASHSKKGKQREGRVIRKWRILAGKPKDVDCGYCTSGQFSFIFFFELKKPELGNSSLIELRVEERSFKI